ncbi:hypothetical protein [Bordetella sp. N]|uniref:hypothetical protein n=1 Tax=Bordetella sp. N TaxID=1746199 RepID=UPI00070ABB1F|nr:hypothetical protein [Bordetella sp. N]ALM85494.1 hypothetical protein ASB57_23245 [Bordetella sp. N]
MKVESTSGAVSQRPADDTTSTDANGLKGLAALEETSLAEQPYPPIDLSKQPRRTHMPMANKHKFDRYRAPVQAPNVEDKQSGS